MSRNMVRLIPLLIMLAISILLASGIFTKESHEMFKDSPLVGYEMVGFDIPALGTKHERFTPRDWRGKVVVLNVFASWCKPCAIEHPIWMKLSQTGKVHLYGLAWKDNAQAVSEWLTKHGNPYHLIGIDQVGSTSIPLALTGIPETFVIDQKGNIYFHHQAPVTQELVDTVIAPLVEKLTSGELATPPQRLFGPGIDTPGVQFETPAQPEAPQPSAPNAQ